MGIRMWYDSIFMENAWYILFYKNAFIHGSEIPSRSNYIFFPHIQCVCIVAFSYQAKKKLKIKRLLPMNSFVHMKKLCISEPNWLPILIAYFPWKASYVSYEHSNCWILHVNEYIYRRTTRRISWTILWCALLWKCDENERKWERERKKTPRQPNKKKKIVTDM